MKTNLVYYLTSVYFFDQPLHASGIFVAHHQEVFYIYSVYIYIYIYIYTHNYWYVLCFLLIVSCPNSDNRQSTARFGTLIVATIYLQLIQNRYMFRSFTVLHCSHQHCVQPVASEVEVVGYL